MAVSRPYKSKNGEQNADFINCVAWRKQAENLVKYMKKGSQIGVEGRIQVRTYDDDSGKRHYITEVVAESIEFLSSVKQENQNSYETNEPSPNDFSKSKKENNNNDNNVYEDMQSEVSSDDLPF